MDDLTAVERAQLNSQLADAVIRWKDNRDLDCVMLCQTLNAVAGATVRAMRERDAA